MTSHKNQRQDVYLMQGKVMNYNINSIDQSPTFMGGAKHGQWEPVYH